MADPMVIDSSVAAKWFLKDEVEADTDLAECILLAILGGDIDGHIPRVALYEFCHVLTKACQTRSKTTARNRITRERALECIREFLRLPLQKPDVGEDECLGAFEMATEHSKRHADMAYLWQAVRLDCKWCTADEKVLEACGPAFPKSHVLLLSSTR